MVKKSMKKLLVGLALSAGTISANAETLTTSTNFFQPRAFSANLAREMLMEGSKHRDSEGWYGEFSATAAYQRSWSQSVETSNDVELANSVNGLGVYPFWSGTNVMAVGSRLSSGAAAFDVDAYQFGLGNIATNSSMTLNPIVYQAGADLMFIVGSSANEPCFFAKIKAPVGVYNINPGLTETIEPTAVAYPAGALSVATTSDTVPAAASTMTQAFAGILSGGQSVEGDFTPMQYGLINGDVSTGAKFGDIEMTAGYRFISTEDNSFSVAVRAAAPTGGQATGKYMLEPIFGRGGNWALGGYVDGHVRLWEGNNENSFVMKIMANAQHLFNSDTVRSYDLTANGGGSKYLLVAHYSDDAYQGQIQNLINFTTLASNSSFGVEGDAVISFAYVARGWSWDLGYEFWGRSAETLEITGSFNNQAYAVLGNQDITLGTSPYTASNACQPLAQMNLASAAPITASSSGPAVNQDDVVLATVAANRVALTDLNVAGAQQNTSLTSKVFTKVTYEWIDSDYRPHLGVMGEFEISNCNNNALPQWGVSLVGGVSF
ncbi:hypothetical protein KBC04_03510 [Candidatus Babeliales bacterium]|nr:hypothetical protein [Candidatus Babeliales bacterium]MBP9843881.1 hypothetical protein [Candidatus Babeliales bacterium]